MEKYYSEEMRQEMIELSDKHVLWDVKKYDEALHRMLTERFADEFLEIYGTDLYYLGRSGRHVCVLDTPENRRMNHIMTRTVNRMQKEFVGEFKRLVS